MNSSISSLHVSAAYHWHHRILGSELRGRIFHGQTGGSGDVKSGLCESRVLSSNLRADRKPCPICPPCLLYTVRRLCLEGQSLFNFKKCLAKNLCFPKRTSTSEGPMTSAACLRSWAIWLAVMHSHPRRP